MANSEEIQVRQSERERGGRIFVDTSCRFFYVNGVTFTSINLRLSVAIGLLKTDLKNTHTLFRRGFGQLTPFMEAPVDAQPAAAYLTLD